GGGGPLREPAARLAKLSAAAGATVVAVDVPSGVDADSGRVHGHAVSAAVTVTFGALKPGLLIAPGAQHAGLVECVDIGLGPALPPSDTAPVNALDAADVAALLPQPAAEATKYTRGVVGVVAGSEVYPGAAVLAVGGAVRAGAGMVRFAGPAHAAEQVRQRWPEAVVTEARSPSEVLAAGRVQAWVVGPGMGTDSTAGDVLGAILATDLPVLVDADGLTLLAALGTSLGGRTAATLLTPHAGELIRLIGGDRDAVEADRLAAVRRAADTLGCTVLLKGSTTVLADPGGPVRVNTTATPFLATAGSGDVLSGGCAALLAGGLAPLDAGSCGAFLHGLAGRLAVGSPGGGTSPVAASDLLATWPAAVRAVTADYRAENPPMSGPTATAAAAAGVWA
ncbi:MAG: NAD(P)H-hydrate dehydratase, partial [Actinomycetota bacterium]|nr:NAD(P)H-hydrate dehydratase [Actinomycetota bacterium]